MKINKRIITAVLSAVLTTGCSSNGTNPSSVAWSDIVLAEPLPVNYKEEVQLARLNEILATANITQEQSAQLLFQRGVVYDNVGLPSLARFDFNQALKLKPDLAEAYNYIGVYLTLTSNFDRAYEAFDSVAELNPNYQFAFFSRGIALYYGERAKLASQDMRRYLSFKPDDPYRIIWQYIVDTKIDQKQALDNLNAIAAKAPDSEWATNVIKLYQGKLAEREFLQTLDKNVEAGKPLAERLCEAYFYLAKYHSFKGNAAIADDYFRLSLATNVYNFIEHKYARLELELSRKADAAG